MTYLPITINVENKQIVIIGGGKVAWQKVQNLLPFSDQITIVAPGFAEEIEKENKICLVREFYNAKHLKGAFLVFACTDSAEVNQQVLKDAQAMGILCNRVDKAEDSDFHSSGIVETDRMLVSINSKNKEVKRIVTLRNELDVYLRERDELISQKEKQGGKVYLVGFGPGNPDLITRRGEKLLYQTDIIFYDDLLDAAFLDRYPGEKVYVGKRRGNHSKEQAEINQELAEAAQKGMMVVRLKGGDPLIFGRGSEERFFLKKNGINVEIVPGISSAIAAAAYGDIPLTHRGISSSVAFGTAHGKNSYKILESDTSVYFMGAKNIQTIAGKYLSKGYSEDFPVGIVYNASMNDQKVIKTNIKELADGKVQVNSPIISIFGNTVDYQNILREKERELKVSPGQD